MNLDWDTAAAGGRIQNCQSLRDAPRVQSYPMTIIRRRRVGKCALVAEGIGTEVLLASLGRIDSAPRSYRITVNPDDMQELLPVRIRWQQRCQHRRPRRDQRPARPPDVQAVRGRERRHRYSLAGALDAQRRDRQPAFDQAGVSHLCSPGRSRCFSRCVPHRRKKSDALRHRPSRSRRSIQPPKRRHSERIAASPTFSATNGPCRRFR